MNLSDVTQATSEAVSLSLEGVIKFIPNLIAAALVVAIGVIVAWAVKYVIVKGLSYIKLKKYTDAVGLGKIFTEKVEFASLLGDLAKWTIIIVFLIPAFEILGLAQINIVLMSLVSFIPSVVVAVVLVVVGAVIADLASRVVRSTAATIGAENADIAASFTKWIIILFVILGALQQVDILPGLFNTITIGAVSLLVIAGGLAFGLGGKEAAADVIVSFRKRLPSGKK
ncbi:MAG: hypothetical protein WCP14_04655 [bacterium]